MCVVILLPCQLTSDFSYLDLKDFSGKHFDYFNHLPQKNSETNDASFESHNIELFESGKKLGLAPSWGKPHPPD